MTPRTLDVLTLLAAIEFGDGDKVGGRAFVRQQLTTLPRVELIEAVMTLCERFSLAMEATRDHVELLAITEFGMHPHSVDKLNLPTVLGSLMGLALPMVREGECCATCAFRQGSAANQCIPTISDAIDCSVDRDKFFCHEGIKEGETPAKLCRGWAQSVKLIKRSTRGGT